jgi:outer membrane protein OmpA-like peptidoglycan-associated protein/opacity protein-like surface antigen
LKRIALAAILISLIAASAWAVDWKGRLGVGIRGPVVVPLFRGSDYSHWQGAYEPFMMGWDGAFEIKYGVPRKFIVNLSLGYAISFDDTTADADQSFKLNKSDNAYSRLNGMLLGLTGQYYFLPDGNVQPYLIGGVGIDMWSIKPRATSSTYKFTDFNLKGGAGISFWLMENLSLDLQGRLTYDIANISTSGIPTAYGDLSVSKNRPFNGYIEPAIGLTWFLGGSPDRDKDGIKDKFDQCPDTPIGALVDQYGCPTDSDNDGVYDGIDVCSDTPKGCVVDITGCPIDGDKDGVCDGLDKCPDTPESVAVDVRGCPLDSDADGVPDYFDKQPGTPKGAIVNSYGVAQDSDGDSVPDGIDKCPDTAPKLAVDEFGCPLAKPLTGKLTLHIEYETGSFEPDSIAKQNLNDLALTLEAYPDLRIDVNGFTDALGSASGNQKLSQKRADAVKAYLISKGTSESRITAQGYGEESPVADNSTPDGRQKNRRIEIVPKEQ